MNTDGCSNTGTINTGYYCELGTVGTADTCLEVCGDSASYFATGSGRCDDGNNVPYDGCSATCYVESGFTCTTGAGI